MLGFFRRRRSTADDPDSVRRMIEAAFRDAGLEVVNQATQIGRWLGELVQGPAIASVWLAGDSVWRPARVVAVQPARRRCDLLLHSPSVPTPGQAVNLSFQRASGVILGDCRVVESTRTGDDAAWLLSLDWPVACLVHEMRQSPRLTPAGKALAWRELGEFLGCGDTADLANVAEGGLCLRLPAERLRRPAPSAILRPAQLGWESQDSAGFALRVIYAVPGGAGEWLLGGSFCQTSAAWQRDWRKRLLKVQTRAVN